MRLRTGTKLWIALLANGGWLLSGTLGIPDTALLSVTGDAHMSGTAVRLTDAKRNEAGAAWWPEKKRLRDGFEAAFEFQISQPGGLERGADGFAFVLQNSGPQALGGHGSAGGFALGDGYGNPDSPGIPESLAVFFDTFRNREANDPSGNYIGIFTNGPIGHMSWPPPRLGFTKKLPFHIKDGRVHSVRISYQPPLLTVWVDESATPVLSVPVDLRPVLDAEGKAHLGFTASTGDGYENHDILRWSLATAATTKVESQIQFLSFDCMPGRNLCTPQTEVVEAHGPGRFHIVLPPYREWAASIPNPKGAPVSIANAQGHICWGKGDSDQTTCAGPDQAPVIQKLEAGSTWFSVKRPEGANLSGAQGFFEFDAVVP